jgi:hypothetical protein
MNRCVSFDVLQTGFFMEKIFDSKKVKASLEPGWFLMRGFSINNLWDEITCEKEVIWAAIVIIND